RRVGRTARRLAKRPEPDDVVALYEILLGREPEASSVIDDVMKKTWLEAVEDIVSSQEFQRRARTPRAEDIERLYRLFLGRETEPSLVDDVMKNTWLEAVEDIVSSQEFQQRARTPRAEDIERLYRMFLGREPEA